VGNLGEGVSYPAKRGSAGTEGGRRPSERNLQMREVEKKEENGRGNFLKCCP